MRLPTRQQYMQRKPRFVEEAAALYEVWPLEPPPGMTLIGFTWEFRGTITLLRLKALVGHRGMPTRIRPIFVPTDPV